MDTTTLRTFIALSQIKNFTKTAQQLFVAQSTVTNRIRDLEEELGTALFIRNRKQVGLTPAGQKFQSYAQRFIALELTAMQDIQTSPTYARKIQIGTTNTIYECHLQKRLCTYLQQKPSVSLHVTISHTAEMLQKLQEGILDVVFSFSALFRDGYICCPYRTDALVLVCRGDDTAYASGITKDDLQKIDYLFCNFALQGVGLYIQDLFPRHHRFPLEIDNSTKLPQYVAAGIGYTFLPRSLIEEDLLKGKLRAVPLLDFAPPKVDSYYITRNPSTIPDSLKAVLFTDSPTF
ncbi:MAG: LysR family transcriptional regulator [Megasphaera sp.]|jgi:LysR family transcriptional repressor of citA|nr:LysR family transcriptional regulator [Megasphaera sp.]MCH4188385.1 LysR family transcriptional regulator [Megasphaera sp.]MCH4218224.1 LysR family transcriptional regulator [Megasphaera sp.]